jgi:hypothetical protein
MSFFLRRRWTVMLRGKTSISFEYMGKSHLEVLPPDGSFFVGLKEFESGLWTTSFVHFKALQGNINYSGTSDRNLDKVSFLYEAEHCGS